MSTRCGGWVVTDQTLIPKDEVRGTEDRILMSPHCLAVFDGVTTETGDVRIDGLTPGQFATENGCRALETAALFDDPRKIVPYLSESLGTAIRRNPGIGRPSYVFAAFIPRHNLVVRVGDITCLVNGDGENRGLAVDDAKARKRQRALEKLLALGTSLETLIENDPTKRFMRYATLRWQVRYTNSEHPMYGYGVVNGNRVPDSRIEYIPMPLGARSLVLTTDGYPRCVLRDRSAETHQALLDLLDRDPLCIREWVAARGVPARGRIPDDCAGLWASF